MPTDPDDLHQHRLICQSPDSAQVNAGMSLVQHLLTYQPRSLLTVNNYFGVLQAVLHDLGIGVLPDYIAIEYPELKTILTDTQSADVPVFLAYPEELRQSKRVSAFRDFVQDEIRTYRQQARELHPG